MEKMVYVKRYDLFQSEKRYYSKIELEERQARARKASYAMDARANEEEEKLLRRGVCPKCHMILPMSGVCDCGYDKRLGR